MGRSGTGGGRSTALGATSFGRASEAAVVWTSLGGGSRLDEPRRRQPRTDGSGAAASSGGDDRS
eukprot:1714931-Pyramimonas_sp.AAC.1